MTSHGLNQAMEMLKSKTTEERSKELNKFLKEIKKNSDMHSVFNEKTQDTSEEDEMCQYEERHKKRQEEEERKRSREAFNKAIEILSHIIVKWSNHDADNHTLKVSTALTFMNYMKDMLPDDRKKLESFFREIERDVGEMGKKTEEEHRRVAGCYELKKPFEVLSYDEDNIYLRNEEFPGFTRQIADNYYQHFPGFEFEFKVLKDFMSCMKLPEDRELLMGIFRNHFGEV